MNLNTNQWLFLLVYVSIMCIVIKILHQRDKKISLKKYEIDIVNGPIFDIELQLDILIDSVFNEYKIYNLEYRPDDYIKELEEKEIVQNICDIVTDRISPVFLAQLSTYFNIDNLGSVIASKISLKVADYRISKNTNG